MEPESKISIETWAEINFGGLIAVPNMRGLCGPIDDSQVGTLYDTAFDRFTAVTKLGKKKYKGKVLNSARDIDDLANHAEVFKPTFIAFLNTFADQYPGLQYSSGFDNKCLVKSGEGLEFKLRYTAPNKISDMLRTTFICESISSLHASILNFSEYCEKSGFDYDMFSFYDSVARFGAEDRIDEKSATPFGYVGVHFHVALTLPIEMAMEMCESGRSTSTGVVPEAASDANFSAMSPPDVVTVLGSELLTLQVEVQFHPSTIYDGTDNCLKELLHPVYKMFTSRAMQQDSASCLQVRKAVEMHYAYAMTTTPP
jgi:hypothetical protein